MPTISSFYGILIRMFYNDHEPPHFHALYGEFQVNPFRVGLYAGGVDLQVTTTSEGTSDSSSS
jgi:hypothetical protein